MRRALKILILLATVGVAWAPALAHADGYVSPWAGVNFGNSQADGRKTFGVSAGSMGGGVIGGEFDLGYSPNFFGQPVTNHALTAMGNLIIGAPIGGTHGAGVRPYVTGGLGLIRTNVNGGVTSSTSSNNWGYNLGAGVMGYFSDHIGMRGDVRYFRDFNNDTTVNPLNLDLGTFHFWRGSIGVVFR